MSKLPHVEPSVVDAVNLVLHHGPVLGLDPVSVLRWAARQPQVCLEVERARTEPRLELIAGGPPGVGSRPVAVEKHGPGVDEALEAVAHPRVAREDGVLTDDEGLADTGHVWEHLR